jgi:pimeloyl-ACP methyl ester carboxylesterase
MILVGDRDRGMEESRRLAAAIPGAGLVILPRTGHELPLTRPAAIAAAVVECTRLADEQRRHGSPRLSER